MASGSRVDSNEARRGRVAPNGDVDAEARRLIGMARNGSKRSQQDLYRAIGALFGMKSDALAPAERRAMLDILRRLSGDVETQVRAALAKRLAVVADAPRDLILLLARDDCEVAHEILLRSPVLRDPDLIELVCHHAWRHQMAVALRDGIGEEVSQALAETGNPEVVVALLNNHSAHISRETFAAIVEDSRGQDAYQGPLVRREDLPRELAERLLAWVSAALRQEIARKFDIDPDVLDDALADAMGDVEAVQPVPAEGRSPAERLVARLHATGELTPAFAFGSLLSGRVELFELVLARLADLTPLALRRQLHETGGQGLAIVCRALDIDRAAYGALFNLGRRGRRVTSEDGGRAKARRLEYFDAMSGEAARLALRRWRHDDALRQARDIIDLPAP